MKHISTALLFSTLAGLSLGVAPLAHAQTAARFSTVEFKDTTLTDALEMIFQAANNPAHTIDPSASDVPIGSITLQNIQWDSALRALANQNNFKVSRGADGSYLVEPREPVLQDGSDGRGSSSDPRSSGRGRFNGGSVPANPFGGSPRGGARNGVTFQMVPSVSTQADAQTTPRLGGANAASSDKTVQIIPVNHIYVGGIAQLFNNSAIITTDLFVSPGGGNNNSNGNNRNGGGNQGGVGFGGGFGGNTGGFGGSTGGFGGNTGGFGGNTGGFGGSTGGFGGNTGGFGGGFGSF